MICTYCKRTLMTDAHHCQWCEQPLLAHITALEAAQVAIEGYANRLVDVVSISCEKRTHAFHTGAGAVGIKLWSWVGTVKEVT